MQLDDDLPLRLFRAAIKLIRRERGLGDHRLGLRVPKLSALKAIAESEGGRISLERLAKQERVSEPTMFATMKALRKRSLINVTQGRKGHKRIYGRMTGAGTIQLRFDEGRLATFLEGVDEDGRATLAKAVGILEAIFAANVQSEKRDERDLVTYPPEPEEV